MSKKAWFCCSGCLIAGLVIGYFIAQARDGSVIANALACLQMTETGEADNHAFQAYQHESSPVAIYALNESLDRLKTAEEFGETPYVSKQMMAFDGVMIHGRLAKLYFETGQTNLSEQHITEALNCAEDVPACRSITNEVSLMALIAKADKKSKQSTDSK